MTRKTSIEAYNEIKKNGWLSARRWEVYDALFKHGPLTRSEIDAVSEIRGAYKSHISARLVELREMGVVEELGEKVCSVTKMNVILWDVTDKLPKKFLKEKKHLDYACRAHKNFVADRSRKRCEDGHVSLFPCEIRKVIFK